MIGDNGSEPGSLQQPLVVNQGIALVDHSTTLGEAAAGVEITGPGPRVEGIETKGVGPRCLRSTVKIRFPSLPTRTWACRWAKATLRSLTRDDKGPGPKRAVSARAAAFCRAAMAGTSFSVASRNSDGIRRAQAATLEGWHTAARKSDSCARMLFAVAPALPATTACRSRR